MKNLKLQFSALFIAIATMLLPKTAFAQNNTSDNEDKPKVLVEKAVEYLQNKQPLSALYYAQLAEALAPGRFDLSVLLGGTSAELNWYSSAIEYFEEDPEIFNYPSLLDYTGYTHSRIGNDKKAMDYYNMIIRYFPHYTKAFNSKADLLIKESRFDEATILIRRGIELNPEYALQWGTMGEIHRYNGNADSAIYYFDKVIELDSTVSLAYLLKSDELRKKGKPASNYQDICNIVIEQETEAINKNSQNYESLFHRAYAYQLLGDDKKMRADIDQALPILDKLIDLYPKAYQIITFRANMYDMLGNKDGANKDFQQVLKLNPADANARYFFKNNNRTN